MNRKIYLIGMMILAMLFASCKKEEKTEVQEEFSIMAVTENDGSKTYLDGNRVKWIANTDVIKVFDRSSNAVNFTCKTVESTGTEANFTSTTPVDDQGEYWAFYPATQDVNPTRSGNTFTFTMPATQTYKEGNTFNNDIFPMAAHFPSGSKSGVKLQFNNAFGILKISATGNCKIYSIVLTDNNTDGNNALSGNFTFNPDNINNNPTAAAGNNSNVLKLNITDGMQLDPNNPTYFYMILPPGCLAGAFNLKFYDVPNPDSTTDPVKEIDKTQAIQNFAVERSTMKTATVDATIIPSFSVGNGVKVQFAPGNLQYRASDQKWQFAEHQWDFIGGGEINWGNGVQGWQIPNMPGTRITGNNTPLQGVTIYNSNNTVHSFSQPRETQSDWIDLFGWGTSGKHANEMLNDLYKKGTTTLTSGMSQRMPYDCFNNDHAGVDYCRAYGPASGDISKANQWAWEANDIYEYGASTPSTDDWRTLSKSEWEYLINKNNGQNYGFAMLTDHPFTHYYGGQRYLSGVVLIPDVFQMPSGLSNFNTSHNSYSNNQYSDADWKKMEDAGAVFLPAAGFRSNEYLVADACEPGHNHRMLEYWSTTASSDRAKAWAFKTGFLGQDDYFNGIGLNEEKRFYGCSVRLVKNVP